MTEPTMKEETFTDGLKCGLVFTLLAIFVGGTLASAYLYQPTKRADFEREAISAGAATYVKDADGTIKFSWKTSP